MHILQVGNGDIRIWLSNSPLDKSEFRIESFLLRSNEIASYIPALFHYIKHLRLLATKREKQKQESLNSIIIIFTLSEIQAQF